MPTNVLAAYTDQLPRLEAMESLLASQRTAVGSGSLKRSASRRLVHEWERRADQPQPAIRPKGPGEYRMRMTELGIGVRFVKG